VKADSLEERDAVKQRQVVWRIWGYGLYRFERWRTNRLLSQNLGEATENGRLPKVQISGLVHKMFKRCW